MTLQQRLKLLDDSGIIGIINGELYEGFVHEDWELEDLFNKFVEQIQAGNAAIWSTSEPDLILLDILTKPSNKKAFRQIKTNIKVTNQKLWLVNYTDLTMVAQFQDESIPSLENSDLEIPLSNGNYQLTIRQMFAPKGYNRKTPPNHYFEMS